MNTVDVFVPGRPAPQGSKRHVGNGVMVESSKHVKPWRQDVREAVLNAMDGQSGWARGVPLWARIEFLMPRPSTARRGDAWHVKRPDLDKLVRAVLDAVGSAGLWADDSQVASLSVSKMLVRNHDASGCHVIVGELR
ncbi:hypothetical protein GCM10012275_28510 [Longimycelium tulufanense]|uniref:Holliday junction resolvase n=1 Tax=Longimycelium tulufanense TaxID=907463 RepID=A0A8J3CCZ0_9PSEU|nr:RusA family crossover junction endodeoxyribonuclease [Longimycelium tulufanense]GGM55692.1 hypothetical protein GCM10012275_28510 [Longimycelium tulufanense]